MMKNIMMKVRDNRGMTLMEVIVALMLFVFVFLILGYGINSALKVMGNANAINNATQSNASGLESLGTSLESSQKATLTPLENKLLINNCALNGKFETATTSKTNDGTSMTLTLFQPAAPSATVPLPTLTAEPTTDKTVVVPSKGTEKENSGNAYYSPDTDYNNKTFISSQGQLIGENEFGNWNGTYDSKYGVLHKGVTSSQFTTTYVVNNTANKYLQQLFFINSEPFVFSHNWTGGFVFSVDFIYIGNGNDKTLTTVETYYYEYGTSNSHTYSFQNATSLIIKPYTSGSHTILYLPQDWKLITKPTTVKYTDDGTLTEYPSESHVIPAGYYDLPDGTDLLKAAYDDTTYNTILSYKKSYSDVAARLTELGIETK